MVRLATSLGKLEVCLHILLSGLKHILCSDNGQGDDDFTILKFKLNSGRTTICLLNIHYT